MIVVRNWQYALLCSVGVLAAGWQSAAADEVVETDQIDGTSANDYRGYYMREYSLVRPYQSGGFDLPFWNIVGSTIISERQVRLTTDIQSLRGAIWNSIPFPGRDWEIIVDFRVHGATDSLFGDGMALWYVKEPNVLGPVFGSKDYFSGLAVFLDTYSNHNGAHAHSHPYITAMVSNGSLHYDHDSDGTHTSLGGKHAGCEASFRNAKHDTQLLVRYVGDVLSIYTNLKGDGIWRHCFTVPGVRLPTHYYFGISAATGELSDNHDVISIRTFKQEFARVEREGEPLDPREPSADSVAAPRDHVDQPRPSRLGWLGTLLLIVVAVAVVLGVLGVGVAFLQRQQQRARKRFY